MSPLPRALRRVLILSLLQSTAISGLEAYVMTRTEAKRLDKQMLKYMRAMMDGKSIVEVEGVRRQHMNDYVFKYWRICPVAQELRMRRLRRYRQWAMEPGRYVQVLAAHLSIVRAERSMGIDKTVTMDMRELPEDATPWAKQVWDDMQEWARQSEDFAGLAHDIEGCYLRLFSGEPTLQARLQMCDPAVIRSAYLSDQWLGAEVLLEHESVDRPYV